MRTALTAEHIADSTVGASRDQLTGQLARLEHNATHLAVGLHVSPHDRHNVGTVTRVDDHTGAATIHFVSEAGKQADREFDWHSLRIIDVEPQARALGTEAKRTIQRQGARSHAGSINGTRSSARSAYILATRPATALPWSTRDLDQPAPPAPL